MPLELLLILVVGGIAGIALALHLLGLSKPRQIASEAEAIAAWNREFPTDHALKAYVSAAGNAALIKRIDGWGLVFPMGADTAARKLDGAGYRIDTAALTIKMPDFTAPSLRIALPDADRALWQTLLDIEQ